MAQRRRIHVTGVVQGVGFRPRVYGLATSLGLTGFVLNTSKGVLIEVEGETAASFSGQLKSSLPPLASLKTLEEEELPPAGYTAFEIKVSETAEGEFALVSPDINTCPDCVREMYDPEDRRHLYPFINCTNCGPRYSIVQGVPYDRPLTTMRPFTMCDNCRAEYEDPADRRFHAQPVACPACGPKVEFSSYPPHLRGRVPPEAGVGADSVKGDNALLKAIDSLRAGLVIAIKGLGGYQLACDAKNSDAVTRLRARKRKSQKPFALMARDMVTVRKYCHVSPAEEALLSGRERPVVLLVKKPEADNILSPDTAPGNRCLGFMLPYTPLHHLLFKHPAFAPDEIPEALVMTSGNLSEEPIVIDNSEAVDKFEGLADAYLTHDRGIYMRVDDSVARVVTGLPRLIRRARGYVPEPLDLGYPVPDILACGGELKNTLCITRGTYAIVSQHIGDLTNYEAMSFFEETLTNLKRTFSARPAIVAHDMHPDYLSTRFAAGYKADDGGQPRLIPVQHHHAHIASCMAENGHSGRAIGVAFDGTGHGTDGKTWGGEFLIADYTGFERFAHISYVPLPGGDKAVSEPWRTALSLMLQAFGPEGLTLFLALKGNSVKPDDAALVQKMVTRGINSPPSSGMGRLFDGVSSLIGIRDRITFEGEAAIALEMAAWEGKGVTVVYPYTITTSPYIIDTSPLIRALVADIMRKAPVPEMAMKFHNTVADMVFKLCRLAREKTGIDTAALSGGVFQNALLFEKSESGLQAQGFRVLTHSKLPTNDGCISLGQAAIAAKTLGTLSPDPCQEATAPWTRPT